MGARWHWYAECKSCGASFSGFSGGPSDCPKCGSEYVLELALGKERYDSSFSGRHDPGYPLPGVPAQRSGQEGMRTFSSGATRDSDSNKLDYEGFLSPVVLRRFAEYMHKHRIQPDGNLRASDNWQKSIPKEAYMKSLWRHFMDVWSCWRNNREGTAWEEALCAMLFNVQGLLFETLRASEIPVGQEVPPSDEVCKLEELARASGVAYQPKFPEEMEAGSPGGKGNNPTYYSPSWYGYVPKGASK